MILLFAIASAGCSGGPSSTEACTIQCSAESTCPAGMACAADGYCHAGGEADDCVPDQAAAPDAAPAASPDAASAVEGGCPLDCPAIDPDEVSLEAGAQATFAVHGGVAPFGFRVIAGGGTIDADGLYTAPATHGYATVAVIDANGDESFADVAVRKTQGVKIGDKVANIRDVSLVCGHPGYWGTPRGFETIELRTSPDGVTEAWGISYPVPPSGNDGGDWRCWGWTLADRKLCDLAGGTCQYVTSACSGFYCGDYGPYRVTVSGTTLRLDFWDGSAWRSRFNGALEY